MSYLTFPATMDSKAIEGTDTGTDIVFQLVGKGSGDSQEGGEMACSITQSLKNLSRQLKPGVISSLSPPLSTPYLLSCRRCVVYL